MTYRLIEAQVYHALLTSRASEYMMRMMAMKNATDNATDLVDDLTMAMNKARQAAITQSLPRLAAEWRHSVSNLEHYVAQPDTLQVIDDAGVERDIPAQEFWMYEADALLNG